METLVEDGPTLSEHDSTSGDSDNTDSETDEPPAENAGANAGVVTPVLKWDDDMVARLEDGFDEIIEQ